MSEREGPTLKRDESVSGPGAARPDEELLPLPDKLRNHVPYQRYYKICVENAASIVFVPMVEILIQYDCLEEARQVCERGLAHNPDSVSGRLMLASVYSKLGRREAAAQVAADVLKRMPDHPEALRYVQGKTRRDEPPLEKTLEAEASELWETPTMAEILAGQGAYEDAVRIVTKLLKRDPKNRSLREKLLEWQEHLTGEEKTVV